MQEQYIHIDTDETKRYYKDREMTVCHRLGGPAIEYTDGHKEWYVDGKKHRLDGPASEWSNGNKFWYINGEYLSEREFYALSEPTLELTLEDIAAEFGVDVSKLKITK
jgi:hypothetical protein